MTRQWSAVALALGVAGITVLHFFMQLMPLVWLRMSSDGLYLPMLVTDMVHGVRSLEGWRLTPAPYLFPDLLITYGVYRLVGDMDVTIVLASLSIFAMTLGAIGAMVWRLAGRRALSATLVTMALGNVLMIWRPNTLEALFALSYHAAAAALALWAMLLTLRVWRSGSWAAGAGLAALTFCVSYSDLLYVVNFGAPTVTTLLLSWRLWPQDKARTTRTLLYVLVPTLLAYIATRLFNDSLENFYPGHGFNVRVVEFLMLARENLTLGGAVFTAVALTVVSIGILRLLRMLRRGTAPSDSAEFFLPTAMLMSVGVTYLAVASRNTPLIWFDTHYLLIAPLAVFTLGAIDLLRFVRERWPRQLTYGVLAGLSAVIVGVDPGPVVIRYTPPLVERLVDARHRLGLRAGLADYWNAKWITYFSRGALYVNQLMPEGAVEPTRTNLDWFGHAGGQAARTRYNFILMDRLSASHIADRFGEPARAVRLMGIDVWLYEDDNRIFDIVSDEAVELGAPPP